MKNVTRSSVKVAEAGPANQSCPGSINFRHTENVVGQIHRISRRRFAKNLFNIVLATLLFRGLSAYGFTGKKLRGVVFHDLNGNGIQDAGEPGIEGVSVSDGLSVVCTAADGTFSIDARGDKATVFISTPSGYVLPGKGAWFTHAAADGEPLRFGLAKDPSQQENFTIVAVADTHIQSSRSDKPPGQFHYKYVAGGGAWNYFFEHLPRIMKSEPEAAFVVDIGDVAIRETAASPVDDAKRYREKVDGLSLPYFLIPGNHDGPETLEIAPPHYSFNRGKFHFVFLKRFADVDKVELTEQFEWLVNDLALLPPNTPTIIFCHDVFNLGSYDGIETGVNRNPEFSKIIEMCDAKAFFYGHIHQLRVEKVKSMLQMSTPSFNFGGGWSQDYFGCPPSYRVVDIKGTEIVMTAAKSIETADNPLAIMCPKDMMVIEGAMYPYLNSCTFWDGRITAIFMDRAYGDISSVSYKMDDGAFLPMSPSVSVPGQQGFWSAKDQIHKSLGPGKHTLTVKAESRSGKQYEKTITLLSDESLIENNSPNLIPNPSLETPAADGMSPEGWNVNGKTVTWDDQVANTGIRSLRIQIEGSTGAFYFLDNIPVDPDGVYNLSLMAKGSDVLKMSYAIFPGMSDAHILRFPDGTYDWTRINTQFRIKPGLKKIGLCIVNHTPEKRPGGSGILWLDDISLRRVK